MKIFVRQNYKSFGSIITSGNALQEKFRNRLFVSPTAHPSFNPFFLFLCSSWAPFPASYQVVQFSSVAQPCPTLCDPMNRSTPGLPVHHQPLEFTQTHVHRVGDAIQPSHPLSSPFPLAPNPSQHQSFRMSQLFTWGGQSTGVSALASFLPKKSQGWSPSEWIGWISL